MAGDELRDFRDHTYVYRRAGDAGLFSRDTAGRLMALYGDNRTDSYYADRRPTAEQAEAMTELAGDVRDYAVGQIRRGGVCACT